MELSLTAVFFVSVLFLAVAFLYSSVGHGGASGYLAVMSLFAFTPKEMSATALLLNILVAGIALVSYYRSGHFSFRFALPFLMFSIPMAFLGGIIQISSGFYKLLLATALLFAAFRLIIKFQPPEPLTDSYHSPSLSIALLAGGSIGLLSGIVGIGGGIFLSPLIMLRRWADTKKTAAVSACFIVCNSIAGLAGRFTQNSLTIGELAPFIIAAVCGGILGSLLGAKKFSTLLLRRILGIVLIIAAIKLFVSGLSS